MKDSRIMAYNSQLGYGAAPNTQYQQQQDQYGASERPHTAESRRNPQYQNPGRAQTPVGGYRYGNNSNELSGRRDGRGNDGWSEDRFGGEQGVIPKYSRTFVETRRDPNSSHNAVGAIRPYHASPVSQFKEPQFDRYQNQEQVHLSGRQDIQPPRFPHQELLREPNYDYEPTNIEANNYNMRNGRINPQPRTAMKPSIVSESVVNHQRREPAMPKQQQQDYAEIYRQQLFPGNEGSTSGGYGTDFSRARVGDGQAQMQYSGPQQGRGKPLSKLSPSSPEPPADSHSSTKDSRSSSFA